MFKKKFSKEALLLASIPMFLSSAVFAADDPFIMGYYENYAGYSNANGLPGALDDWDEATDQQRNSYGAAEGRVIPQPSYPIPNSDYGFPVMDTSQHEGMHTDSNNAYQQSTNNTDLIAKLEGLSALTYAFMLPADNGALVFNDPYADLSSRDKASGGFLEPGSSGDSLGMGDFGNGLTHYGQFDAFVNLNKSDGSLEHWVATGGWAYRSGQQYHTDSLVSSSQNQANFLASLQVLKDAGVEGIDLDIEFDQPATDWESSLLLEKLGTTDLVQQIKDIGLKIAVTVQATPKMLVNETFTSYINHMFSQGMDHFSLMTYDLHGAFDAGSPTPYTGFNSSLFPAPDGLTSPFKDETEDTDDKGDFSVDTAINALEQGGLNPEYFAKVNIGLPTYSRANLTGINSADGGLFQSIPSTSKVLPGDRDDVKCLPDDAGSNGFSFDAARSSCAGSFNYNYILENVLTSGFEARDWTYTDGETGKTYYIGTTAYNQYNWQPVTSTLSFTPDGQIALPTVVNGLYGYTYPSDGNIFMSYISGNVAKSYGQYAKEKGLGGAIIWAINGDAAYTDTDNSLIHNFTDGFINGDSDDNTPPDIDNQAPEVVNLEAPASVNELEEASINADVNDDGDLSELTYVWQTTSGSIVGEGQSVTFVAPEVDEDTVATITLTVTDGEGAATSDSIDINVINLGDGDGDGTYPAWDPDEVYKDKCTYVTYNSRDYVNAWNTDGTNVPSEADAQINMDKGWIEVSNPWLFAEDERNKANYGCE